MIQNIERQSEQVRVSTRILKVKIVICSSVLLPKGVLIEELQVLFVKDKNNPSSRIKIYLSGHMQNM